MRTGALVVFGAAALAWAGTAAAQGRPVFTPAEPPPADFAGDEWRDSQGCQFMRSTSGGAVAWLPVLNAQRELVCGLPPLAAAAPPAPVIGGPGSADDPLAALARLADLDTDGRGRLVFVEPDDRVRIVLVDMPSILVGGDPFGMNAPMPAVARAPARGALVGYHPQPARLQVAPPIHGFGTDPEAAPRLRRAQRTPPPQVQEWDGAPPVAFTGDLAPAPDPAPDSLGLPARAQTGAPIWIAARR